MKIAFSILVVSFAFLVLGGTGIAQYRVIQPWNAKFVANYDAHYPNHKPVKSYASVELHGMDRTYSPAVLNGYDCEQRAWTQLYTIAKGRNPGATKIQWNGWTGRCWQGEKPAEPVAWSTYSHGIPW